MICLTAMTWKYEDNIYNADQPKHRRTVDQDL
jgi:hypothetical protein